MCERFAGNLAMNAYAKDIAGPPIRPCRPHPQAARIPLHAQAYELAQHGRDRIGVLRGQCLYRCIENRAHLVAEIAAWERRRNASGARVN